jgi:hypothetical protein
MPVCLGKFFKTKKKQCYIFFSTKVDQLFLPDFSPVGDGKLECRASDEKNHTLLNYNTFFYVKKGFPAG